MTMEYTDRMEELSFQKWGVFDVDYDNVCDKIIEIVDGENAFRTFGEGLFFFVNKKYPEVDKENIINFLNDVCKTKNIPINDIASNNTLRNWFKKGARPKKGDNSRRVMFALAFVLDLDPEKTAQLFHKVYMDRAFDFRNIEDIVYYFCLDNKKSWSDAKRLIQKATLEETENEDDIKYTRQIQKEIQEIRNEDALIAYIKKHKRNLEKKNVSARKNYETILEESKKLVKKESELPEYQDVYKNCDKNSLNFLYEVITGQFVSTRKGTVTLFKNSRLPKEIKNRFPEAISLSKKNLTYEELRKLIILLASYNFWFKGSMEQGLISIDDYISEMNAILIDSGFSPMYYGNPYDWMFLYCSLFERPLDTFRDLIAEALEE